MQAVWCGVEENRPWPGEPSPSLPVKRHQGLGLEDRTKVTKVTVKLWLINQTAAAEGGPGPVPVQRLQPVRKS